MKKIIATVLAMVMALALCTTAFAVSSVYAGAEVGTDTIKPGDGQVLSLEKFSTGSADAKTFDTYKLWLTTTKTGAKVEANTGVIYWLATDASYDTVFVNGTSITYLLTADTTKAWVGTAKTVSVVKGDVDDAKCGQYYSATGAAIYTYDGTEYDASKTATDRLVNVDGKAVYLTTLTSATEKPHTYKADTATVNGKTTVTKVYCTTCKASFEFKDNVTDAVKAFGSNYAVVGFKADGTVVGSGETAAYTVYVKTGEGTTNTSTTTKPSPKTFDAGIAMYVGMALTSVAGSAVVIGKKKEF